MDYKNFRCKVQFKNISQDDACAGICDCLIRPFDNTTFINCTNKNLSKIPSLTSVENASKIELYLQSNKLKELPDMQQPGFNKVKLLDLSNNLITEFDEKILNSSVKVKIYL